MMDLPDDIELNISSLMYGPHAEPQVVLQFVHQPTGSAMSPLALTPVEAITISSWLMQAAEVAVTDSRLLMALRSLKFSEEQIDDVFRELRDNRQQGGGEDEIL